MGVNIDLDICNGCGKLKEALCERICPGDLMSRNRHHKAEICSQSECWTCGACVKVCPVHAIDLKLPTQIADGDASLSIKCKKHKTIFEIKNGNKVKEKFVIPAINEHEFH